MSLRDLANPQACAAASSSSRNPLAAVADALLPATRPHPFPPPAAASASASAPASAQAHLLHGDLSVPLPHFPHPREPLPPTAHGSLSLPPLPVRVAPPPPGGPTDLFERAFRDAHHRARAPAPLPVSDFLTAQRFHTAAADDLVADFSRFAINAVPPPSAHARYAASILRRPPPPPLPSRAYARSYAAPGAALERDAAAAVTAATATGLTSSRSWGDEFTSMEGGVAVEVERGEKGAMVAEEGAVRGEGEVGYGASFEEMYEAAFREYLGREPEERRAYRFENRKDEARCVRSAREALEEARRLRGDGKLALAIRGFEEALDRGEDDPHPGLDAVERAMAWHLLGVSLAETDDDASAILALRQGVDEGRGKGSVWHDESLIALAVSYTNELDHAQACRSVHEWFEQWKTRAPGWKGGDGDSSIERAFQDATQAGSQQLLRHLHKAAEAHAEDVNIFIVMGVLYNLNREYSAAADTLRYAVMLQPKDPSLWNKLGATLANGGEGDDALRAYRRAVDLNPSLVRAWVNVGTAYANRGEFPKAARYYLKAVSMAGEDKDSEAKAAGAGRWKDEDRMSHVWGYLKTALLSMDRADILHHVDSKDISSLRKHFAF